MAKNTNYFTHDYNARNDNKLVKLKQCVGMSGVGIYWCLVEMLFEQGGKIKISDLEIIAKELKEKRAKVEKVVMNFELFEMNFEFLWSNSVNERLKLRKEKSDKARESVNYRHQKVTNVNHTVTQSKVNESKDKVNVKEEIIDKEIPVVRFETFKIGEQVIPGKVSDWIKKNFQTFLEQWEMKNKDPAPVDIFSRMDVDFSGYHFRDTNHVQNTFKSTYQLITNEKIKKSYAGNKLNPRIIRPTNLGEPSKGSFGQL